MERRGERTIINLEVKKILGKEHFIHHPNVIAKSNMFKDDGVHLSDMRNDYLIVDFKLMINNFVL